MTLNLGNLWIELWNGSDAVLWLLTSALVNGLLVFLLYRGRHSLELLLSAKQVDLLLKFLILYLVCALPVVSMVFLYRGVFGYVGPPEFGDGFIHTYKRYPISFSTNYREQMGFWLTLSVWLAGFLVCIIRSCRRDRSVLRELRALHQSERRGRNPFCCRVLSAGDFLAAKRTGGGGTSIGPLS